jgi:diadenosine tetraphosphate (Ap4A) HIT family hydrolase
MADFTLDPRIADVSDFVTDLPLCTVRLMHDANYPWLLLVPRRAETAEIGDLPPSQQAQLMTEIARASTALRAAVPCDRINVAALGNAVPVLHVHVIARQVSDPAWPRPVWGSVPAKPYGEGVAERLIATLAESLR